MGLADQLLTPSRLTELLQAAIRLRHQTSSDAQARKSALERERKDIDRQIDRLITAIADGTLPDLVQVRAKIDDLTARREECVQHLARLQSNLPAFRQVLSNQQAQSIGATLKRRLLDAPPALKRRYVRGLVSDIVVNRDRAIISGPPAAIAAAITAGTLSDGVRTSVREWRALGE